MQACLAFCAHTHTCCTPEASAEPLPGPLAPPLQAHIVLNLTADLRSEFTWNTKQLFVFVNFEFATRKNVRNEMVMWSAIVEDKVRLVYLCIFFLFSSLHGKSGRGPLRESGHNYWRHLSIHPPAHALSQPDLPALPACLAAQENALIQLPVLRAQYPYALTDQGFNLRNRQFNITVAWNVMPRVGALYTQKRTFAGGRGRAGAVGGQGPGNALLLQRGGWRACQPAACTHFCGGCSSRHMAAGCWLAGCPLPALHNLDNSSFIPGTGAGCGLHAGLGRLPDTYIQPSLGKVRRPGSEEMVEIPGPEEEVMEPYYVEA